MAGSACSSWCGWCGGCTSASDRTYEECGLYCAVCNTRLGQVQIEVVIPGDKRYQHFVCSDICRDTMLTSLEQE